MKIIDLKDAELRTSATNEIDSVSTGKVELFTTKPHACEKAKMMQEKGIINYKQGSIRVIEKPIGIPNAISIESDYEILFCPFYGDRIIKEMTYPVCKVHGAMNKVSREGIWRCLACNVGCFEIN